MGAHVAVGSGRRVPWPGEREERRGLASLVAHRVTVAMIVAHGLGAIDVFALLWWVLPAPGHQDWSTLLAVNVVLFAVTLPVMAVVGTVVGRRLAMRGRRWLSEGRPPTPEELRSAIREPLTSTAMNAAFWVISAVLFGAVNAFSSPGLGLHVATTILLGGVTTCAIGYLLLERLVRPITALALAHGRPSEPIGPGVKGRLVLGWVAATAVPLLGLVLLALGILLDGGVSTERAATSILALTAVALAAGAIVAVLSAKAVAEPIWSVREAMRLVEEGLLDTEVPVDDGSEIGLLQSGFNRMAAGLRERERLRDLFGRHVGEEVARAALEDGGVHLGGEERDVAVLFVDVVGSTALAASQTPDRVVMWLNRFFALVVEVVDAHGGWVNKFEGDGAMCVFGAPVVHPSPESAALAAGRDLQARLRSELGPIPAAIGLSAGRAVAGNVGAERRFEYTVIGDPVNEAARLCELAKRTPGRLLASEAIVRRVQGPERERWCLGESEVLRGRSSPTRLALPAQ